LPSSRPLAAQAQPPDDASPNAILAAMADPTRRQLLATLAERGPATATELAASLPITRQAVAKHLTVLSAAGLVASARQGRDVRFRVQSGGLAVTAHWLAALAAEWDDRLAAIKRIAEGGG
jgi:DNA-binding transcriptional ArsR family regulator